jgi:lipoate-protein ligase A
LRERAREGAGDLLRFYSFAPCLLLGQTQDINAAAAVRRLSSSGVEVARRVTGGGAVYMSQTMLAWDFLTAFSSEREILSERVGAALATALGGLGWPAAAFAPPNDIMIEGRKVSGAATASRGQAFLHQGTLLLRDERQAMAQALGVSVAVLRDRVSCLEHHGSLPNPEALQAAIVEALATEFALQPESSALTSRERVYAEEEFAAEVGCDAYVLGYEVAEGGQP